MTYYRNDPAELDRPLYYRNVLEVVDAFASDPDAVSAVFEEVWDSVGADFEVEWLAAERFGDVIPAALLSSLYLEV